MNNGLFKIDGASLIDAVITSVVFAVVAAGVQLVSTSGFNLFTADWILIGKNVANLGFIAGVVSLGKDILSTNSGSLLAIGPSNQ